MSFEEFIERVSTATQYSFSENQLMRIKTDCDNISEQYLKKIASIIERSPNHPKNIYGLVLGNLQWAKDEIESEKLKQERWTAKEDCAKAEEFNKTMDVTALICRFEHSADLLPKFSEGLLRAIKKDCTVEFLDKAKEFYLNKIREGVKLKYEDGFSMMN